MPDLIPVPVAYATQPRGNMTAKPPGEGCRYFQVTCAGCGRQEAAEWHVTQSGPTRDADMEPTYGVPWPSGRPWRVVGIMGDPDGMRMRREGEWVCGPVCALRTSHRDIQGLWPDYQGGGWVMPTDTPLEATVPPQETQPDLDPMVVAKVLGVMEDNLGKWVIGPTVARMVGLAPLVVRETLDALHARGTLDRRPDALGDMYRVTKEAPRA